MITTNPISVDTPYEREKLYMEVSYTVAKTRCFDIYGHINKSFIRQSIALGKILMMKDTSLPGGK